MNLTPEIKKLAETLRKSGLAASESEAVRMAYGINETETKTQKYFDVQSKIINQSLERKPKLDIEKPKVEVKFHQSTSENEIINSSQREIHIEKGNSQWELIGTFKNENENPQDIISGSSTANSSEPPLQAVEETPELIKETEEVSLKENNEMEPSLMNEDLDMIYGEPGNKEVSTSQAESFSLASNQDEFIQEFNNEVQEEKSKEIFDTMDQNPISEMPESSVDLSSMFNFSSR